MIIKYGFKNVQKEIQPVYDGRFQIYTVLLFKYIELIWFRIKDFCQAEILDKYKTGCNNTFSKSAKINFGILILYCVIILLFF